LSDSELYLNVLVEWEAPCFIFGSPWFETSAFWLVSLNEISRVKVEVLTEVTVFWDVTPCSLVGVFSSEDNGTHSCKIPASI
jgi:hypothetical protein